MTEQELFAAVEQRWNGTVFARVATGEGVDPAKRVLEFGLLIPGTPRKRAFEKSITFDATALPDDALDKIASVIA